MSEERLKGEVQIVVHGGVVQSVYNWPAGLPGAVYDYDQGEEIEDIRCPIEQLIDDGDVTNQRPLREIQVLLHVGGEVASGD